MHKSMNGIISNNTHIARHTCVCLAIMCITLPRSDAQKYEWHWMTNTVLCLNCLINVCFFVFLYYVMYFVSDWLRTDEPHQKCGGKKEGSFFFLVTSVVVYSKKINKMFLLCWLIWPLGGKRVSRHVLGAGLLLWKQQGSDSVELRQTP